MTRKRILTWTLIWTVLIVLFFAWAILAPLDPHDTAPHATPDARLRD